MVSFPLLRCRILSGTSEEALEAALMAQRANFLNGMLGNFVFLFGALYLGSLHGTEALTRYLYLPYLGGMILSMILGKRILQGIFPNTVPVLLGGLALSLFVLLFHKVLFLVCFIKLLAIFDQQLVESTVCAGTFFAC